MGVLVELLVIARVYVCIYRYIYGGEIEMVMGLISEYILLWFWCGVVWYSALIREGERMRA